MTELNVSPEQKYVMDRARRHVGRSLTLIEHAIPEEQGELLSVVKKQLSNILYDFRNDILQMLSERGVDYDLQDLH